MEYVYVIVMLLKYDHLKILSLKMRMICQMCISLHHFAFMYYIYIYICATFITHTICLCPPFPHLSSTSMFSLLSTKIVGMRYNILASRLWMVYVFFLPVFCLCFFAIIVYHLVCLMNPPRLPVMTHGLNHRNILSYQGYNKRPLCLNY